MKPSNTACISFITLATLTLAPTSSQAHHSQLPDCSVAETTPCTEPVWVDGEQRVMTFIDLAPHAAAASDIPFYVTATQTDAPQGLIPFLHDHVTDEPRSDRRRHGRHHKRDVELHYRGFFVLCTQSGMESGACEATITAIPMAVPLAKKVNGQPLTSIDRVQSAANAGNVMLIDTGAVFVASLGDD